MRRILFICLICSGFPSISFAQKQIDRKVSIQIIDQDSSEKSHSFKWPFEKGQKPVGGTQVLIEKVDKILRDNGVPCPPKRKKLTDNVWICGNGKKIKTNDAQLIELFTETWEDEE